MLGCLSQAVHGGLPAQAVKLSRWQSFMNSLHLDKRVDFEEGDIGLAGGTSLGGCLSEGIPPWLEHQFYHSTGAEIGNARINPGFWIEN